MKWSFKNFTNSQKLQFLKFNFKLIDHLLLPYKCNGRDKHEVLWRTFYLQKKAA